MTKPPNGYVRGINVNTIVIPAAILIPIIGATWIISAKLNNISSNGDLAVKGVEEVKLDLRRIDTSGTQGSQQATHMNTDRILKLEEVTGKLIPDVAEIKTNMSWIAEWVRGQKQEQRK